MRGGYLDTCGVLTLNGIETHTGAGTGTRTLDVNDWVSDPVLVQV